MNDSTLPPTLAPVSSRNIPNKASRKAHIRKGFGLSDWIRLLKVSRDPAQRKVQPFRNISKEEIRRHDSVHDGWVSLRGKVYNVTPYLHYHPGGVEIMEKSLGRDMTKLFDKFHPSNSLIGPLQVGYLAENKIKPSPTKNAPPSSASSLPNGGNGFEFSAPAPRPPKNIASLLPVPNSAMNAQDRMDDTNPWGK